MPQPLTLQDYLSFKEQGLTPAALDKMSGQLGTPGYTGSDSWQKNAGFTQAPPEQPSQSVPQALNDNSENATTNYPIGEEIDPRTAMAQAYLSQSAISPLDRARIESEMDRSREGINYLDKLRDHLSGAPVQVDVSPINALVDSMHGSQLQKGYTKPISIQDRVKSISDIQKLSQDERSKIIDQMSKLAIGKSNSRALGEMGRADRANLNRATKFDEALDPTKGTGNFASQWKTKNAADRALVLVQQTPDLNFNEIQTEDFASAIAALVAGGSQTSVRALEGRVPHSISGDKNKWLSWLQSNPRGLEQQKFIATLVETAEREKVLADKNIKETQLQRIGSYEDLASSKPNHFDTILNNRLGISREQYAKLKNDPKARKEFLGGEAQQVTHTKPNTIPPGATQRRKMPDGSWEYR